MLNTTRVRALDTMSPYGVSGNALFPHAVQGRKPTNIDIQIIFQVIQIGPNSVPYNLYELRMDNLAELIVGAKAFSNTTALHKVVFSRIRRLHVHTAAFTNISAASFILNIEVHIYRTPTMF